MDKDNYVIAQALAAICNESAFTAETHQAREDALAVLPDLLDKATIELNNLSLDQLCTAYFLCTYCHLPTKHRIKKSINKIFRDNMLAHGIIDETDFTKPKQRMGFDNPHLPRVLVITNSFTSTHVMYRCFAKSLAALKRDFHVVNLCLHQTDFIAAQCFHKVIQAQLAPIHYLDTLRQLRKLILEIAPDAIVYADIAMHPFGVFLSNLRLAPLQVVLAGHPAPSQSGQIDAYICESVYRNCTTDFLEPVVTFPVTDFQIADPVTGPLNLEKQKGRNIIVPTSLHKITYPFLQTLKTIQEETGSTIHMTSNIVKGNAALAELLKLSLPGINYYPALHYDNFIKLISSCDMFLMPYPFNGFSTILDCFTQGLPGVVMDAASIESHQGAVMMNRGGGMSCGAIAQTEHDYIAAAVELAKNDDLREIHSFGLDDVYGTDFWKARNLFKGESRGITNTLQKLLDRPIS